MRECDALFVPYDVALGGGSVPHPRACAKYRKYILNTPLQIVHLFRALTGSLRSKEVSIEVHVVEVEVRTRTSISCCDFFAFVKHTV